MAPLTLYPYILCSVNHWAISLKMDVGNDADWGLIQVGSLNHLRLPVGI